jgi:energy-coupling factor transport system permease protein
MKSYYCDQDSFLHRLNPLSKVVATAPVLLFLALVTDPWTPAAFILLFGLVSIGLGSIPILRYVKTVAPLITLVTGFVIMYPLVVDPARVAGTAVAFEIGPLVVRWGGVVFGLATALRIFSLMLGTMLFTLTTDSMDFIRALVQQWRLPYRIGYSAMAAYRFVPMLGSELEVIKNAHKIRGISDRGGMRAQFDRAKRYAVPLLATAIRKAERTALAMDSRAFGAFETRTYSRQLVFAPRDWIFVIAFWAVSLGTVLTLARAGLLGSLVLLQDF